MPVESAHVALAETNDDSPPPAARPLWRQPRAWGYGLLGTGAAMVVARGLAFAFDPALTFLLMLATVPVVGLGWFVLIHGSWRRALVATGATAVIALAWWVGVPGTQSLSWRMLVWTHRGELAGIVEVLRPARMVIEDVDLRREPVCARPPGADLPPEECASLERMMRDVGAHHVWKEGDIVVLETYGWFNGRGGLLHCTRDCTAQPAGPLPWRRYVNHISGDWYRWSQ